jgi:hypothetical protein
VRLQGAKPDEPQEIRDMQITPIDLKDPELYRDGIPHEVFTQVRPETPVSWFLALAEHPEQKCRLLDDPSLMVSAASEMRW